MKKLLTLGLLAWHTAAAQGAPLSRATEDTLVRVLLAEDRADSTDASLVAALTSTDARVRDLARRALARIRDPKFVARDSFPSAAPSVAWPEPEWRLRYRALATKRNDCAALRAALFDGVWQVRLRASDLAMATFCNDDALVQTMRDWVDALPRDATIRKPGGVSWHAAAHGLLALARLRPVDAKARLPRLASHRQWEVRMYAARAAGMLSDTATLRALARDPDDNVKEAAIDALSKLVGHTADDAYLAALNADGAQAVRAAARALTGSSRPGVRSALDETFERWVKHGNASEKDARVALLEAAGRPAGDDRPPPRDAVHDGPALRSIVRGDTLDLRVTMAPASGGGHFTVRLRGDAAPIMSARVLDLVEQHYYDGGNWHRVEADFVIQGGGPGTNEYVGHRHYMRDELSTIPHPRGSVGMSTRSHDTGDAQWFINLKDNPRLVTDYTVFGEVIEGMDVVDGILEGDRIQSVTVTRRPATR